MWRVCIDGRRAGASSASERAPSDRRDEIMKRGRWIRRGRAPHFAVLALAGLSVNACSSSSNAPSGAGNDAAAVVDQDGGGDDSGDSSASSGDSSANVRDSSDDRTADSGLDDGGASDAGEGVWSTAAVPLLTPRYGAAAVAQNGLVYVFGGCTGGQCAAGEPVTPTVEAYDPAQNTWTSRSPMPTARGNLVAASIGGTDYAIGGGLGTLASALPTVEAYDVASDTWTSKASMSTARMAPAVGAIGGKLYVAGGHCCDDSGSDSLEIYDPGSNTWTGGAAPPTEREEVGYGVINGLLYVAGGLGSARNLLTTLEVYDPVANAWSTKAPMPIAVDGQGSAVVGGKLFLFGGSSASSTSALQIGSSVLAYDPAEDTWSSLTPLPTARYGAATAAVGMAIFVAGGYGAAGVVSVLEVFTLTGDSTLHDGG
jgi:N-acetylneuraminic acid mutarotase